MSLKDAARKIIVDDMFRPLHIRGEWKILVVDTLGKKIISTCLKMKDMLDNGITLIEDLSKTRQPLTYLDAVYFVRPNQENIGHIKKDFGEVREYSGRLYKNAHLFFTEIIPDEMLKDIAKSDIAPFVQTVKELNLAFLPIEERVFSLDNPAAYNEYYGGKMTDKRLDEIAEQLVTVCATLDESPCPKVRTCNSNLDCVKKLAAKVQAKLEKYKEADILTANNKSQLIILDRGFDPVSPFLHELTFQSMAYDLLSAVAASSKIDPVKNTYTFDSTKDSSLDDNKKEIILDTSNEVWRELRHLHISTVLQIVNQKTNALMDKYANLRGSGGGDPNSMLDMKSMINKMPKYKREEANLNSFIKLAEDCMTAYNSGTVERAVKLEQDMSTGFDSTGKPIGERFVKACVPVFVPQNNGPLFTHYQKLRVLILYVLNKKGLGKHLTKETLLKLIERAEIKKEEKAVNNMIDLGIDIFGTSEIQDRREPPRKERDTSGVFETSRWTPVVMDIMEAVVHEKNLDTSHYPFFHAESQNDGDIDVVGKTSLMRGHGKKQQVMGGRATGPKLIIFVMGSISYSEMRCAHQVSETQTTRNGWEVIIGSDNILTPERYLDNLIKLKD